MSCPSWVPGSEADASLRSHLAGCRACRRRAVEADPLLAFSLMPEPRLDGDEVARMQQRVRASLRAHELEANVTTYSQHNQRRVRFAAAAAVLLAAAGSLVLVGTPTSPEPIAAQLPAEWPGDEEALLRELATLPVLEAPGLVAVKGDERTAVMEIGRLDV